MEYPQDLFDFSIPDAAEPIMSGLRRTDPEEVRLVIRSELEKFHGRPEIRWNVYRRRNGAAVLVFETSSKRDCDALKSALDGFRSRFGVSRECRYENDHRVTERGVQWQHRLELEFGRFVEIPKLPPANPQIVQRKFFGKNGGLK